MKKIVHSWPIPTLIARKAEEITKSLFLKASESYKSNMD